MEVIGRELYINIFFLEATIASILLERKYLWSSIY